ncbi:uncharacterized protein LOC117305897 isoform X2 [Asterias rubens]|uniref:uncharacterized protein LOC117305897 isoform X2 n=1 Tax=Asterias rubens TaxID=7604 RepID=UPI001455229C|nr:uncharacterized protein LOC117305897 isoform X2 [Asterias rubens]
MNDMANMYCRPDDNSCFTVEACNELYANFPKLPDIPIECDGTYGTCRTFGCSWWLLMLLLLIPISCCLACYLRKCYRVRDNRHGVVNDASAAQPTSNRNIPLDAQ